MEKKVMVKCNLNIFFSFNFLKYFLSIKLRWNSNSKVKYLILLL